MNKNEIIGAINRYEGRENKKLNESSSFREIRKEINELRNLIDGKKGKVYKELGYLKNEINKLESNNGILQDDGMTTIFPQGNNGNIYNEENIDHTESYEGNYYINSNGKKIPVDSKQGRRYEESFNGVNNQEENLGEYIGNNEDEIKYDSGNDYVYQNENSLIEVTSELYFSNYKTLEDNRHSIKKIQLEMFKMGKIKREDLGKFGPATAKFVYQYHPNYYLNSYDPEVKQRAENLIALDKINEKQILNEYQNVIDNYGSHPSVVKEGRPAFYYKKDKNGEYTKKNKEGVIEHYSKIQLPVGTPIYGRSIKYPHFGYDNDKPIAGTAISVATQERLNGIEKSNNIYVFKRGGRMILQFYLGGKLKVSSYISPGLNTDTRRSSLIGGIIGGKGSVDKYHVSFSDDITNIKQDTNGNFTGWGMPFAVNIHGPEFLHSRNVGKTKWSHGCTGLPPFYETVLSKYLENIRPKIIYSQTLYSNKENSFNF